MTISRRARWFLALAICLPVLVVAGFGLYAASLTGDLPWQTDPTRIPVTPFADIPGFGDQGTPVPTVAPFLATNLVRR
jgi:hypothetical protein